MWHLNLRIFYVIGILICICTCRCHYRAFNSIHFRVHLHNYNLDWIVQIIMLHVLYEYITSNSILTSLNFVVMVLTHRSLGGSNWPRPPMILYLCFLTTGNRNVFVIAVDISIMGMIAWNKLSQSIKQG